MARILAFLRQDGGGAAVEMALVIPAFLAATIGAINLSLLLYGATSLHYAAERTARCIAVQNWQTSPASPTACLTGAPALYIGPIIGATFVRSTAGCGNTVTGSGALRLVTGLVNPLVPISASSCYPLQ